jgi:molecular chaperone GrpE (heat shock protein)
MPSIDPDSTTLLQNLGKGLTQINLRLSRLLEREAPPAGAGGDDSLDPLLDLLDAVDEAIARRPSGRSFWGRRRDDDLWRGLVLAAECARDQLRTRGIEATPAEGPFDDRLHRAIERVPGPPERAGTLAHNHRRGWVRAVGDQTRVLRVAQVSVWTEQGR